MDTCRSRSDVIGIAGEFGICVLPTLLMSSESRDHRNAYVCHGVNMLRTVMTIAFFSAFLAVTPVAFSAEADAEKCEKSPQCEKDKCAAVACTGKKDATFATTSDDGAKKACSGGACEAKTCPSTAAQLTQVTTTLDSGSEAVCSGNKQCCAGDELVVSEACCSDNKTCCVVEDLANNDVPCNGCPAELAAATLTAAACQCGDGCGCCTDAEQKYRHQIVALHWKLMEEGTKNAVLAAQLKHSESLAKAQVEFAKQMLKKEIENVHLHAELQLTNAKAGLATRVADLEKRLESINVRLATKPTASQVK